MLKSFIFSTRIVVRKVSVLFIGALQELIMDRDLLRRMIDAEVSSLLGKAGRDLRENLRQAAHVRVLEKISTFDERRGTLAGFVRAHVRFAMAEERRRHSAGAIGGGSTGRGRSLTVASIDHPYYVPVLGEQDLAAGRDCDPDNPWAPITEGIVTGSAEMAEMSPLTRIAADNFEPERGPVRDVLESGAALRKYKREEEAQNVYRLARDAIVAYPEIWGRDAAMLLAMPAEAVWDVYCTVKNWLPGGSESELVDAALSELSKLERVRLRRVEQVTVIRDTRRSDAAKLITSMYFKRSGMRQSGGKVKAARSAMHAFFCNLPDAGVADFIQKLPGILETSAALAAGIQKTSMDAPGVVRTSIIWRWDK
jgi:hypothetical protein